VLGDGNGAALDSGLVLWRVGPVSLGPRELSTNRYPGIGHEYVVRGVHTGESDPNQRANL
jgi:hypothetical protein